MGRLQRFWSEGVWQQIAVIVGALLLCGCCGLVVGGGVLAGVGLFVPASSSTSRGVIYGPSTSVGGTQIVSSSTVGPAATVAATHAQSATGTRTPARVTPTAAAGGPPALGAPLVDFTAAYGPVIGHGVGNSDNFYADKAQTIIVNVTFAANGTANHIAVSGPTSWPDAQTFAACYVYLPPDAVEYNNAPPNTDYHSSLGNIVLADYGGGACLVFIAS